MKTYIHLGNMIGLNEVVFSMGKFFKKNQSNKKIGNQLVLYDEATDSDLNRLCRAVHSGVMHYTTDVEPLAIDKYNNKYFKAHYKEISSTVYFNTIPLYNREPIYKDVKCVYLFTNWLIMFDHNRIDFSEVNELHFYLCTNQLENETIEFLEKFCSKFEKPIVTYYYYKPSFLRKGIDGYKEICEKCKYKWKSNKELELVEKYSCIMRQRMIEPGQVVTPFDVETDYPVCSMLTRQNNEMELMVYDDCPYYVEHYMKQLKATHEK